MTTPTGIVVRPEDGRQLPGVDVRNTVKITHEATDGTFAAFEETTEPGMGPPVHVHRRQWEYFRVLEGEFEFLIGDQRHRALAGTVAIVPPDTRHGFRNVASTPSTLEFLVTPAAHIDEYFERLTALLAAGETDADVLDRLGAEYDSINVGPPLAD